jgi:hypothetical protein
VNLLNMRRGVPRLVVPVVALVAAAVACTPTFTTPTTTTWPPGATAPVVQSFSIAPAVTTAPAVVTAKWTVADPQGTDLTCSIDGDGDGTVDQVVSSCQGSGSRNVTLENAGSYTPTITVSDGTESAQRSTTTVITAGPTEPYDIVVRPITALDPDVQAAFDQAAARWEQILTRGVPDVAANLPAGWCVSGAPAETTIDDLVIDVEVAPVDGPGGILGSAGPCLVGADGLPRLGGMTFDSADVATLLGTGQFDEVVLHEMGHVLGFGTVWTDFAGLTSGFGGSDPRFLGNRAVAEWQVLGGSGGVKVEADGGDGTAYAHWDETTFGSELMTGYLDALVDPLSRVTIASLADLGYHVDLSQADPYALPGPALRVARDMTVPPPTGRMILLHPKGSV